ncbi:MAG TPA: hypothetical protein VHB21_20745, partial [Minicystis sp.]|nr:hypothetical protein [Minicystis sp.]
MTWWAFGVAAAFAAFAGCTQDFGQFEPSGSSGAGAGNSTGANMGGGGSTSSSSSSTGGGMPECTTPNDCPAATKPCEVATCKSQKCGFGNAPNGDMCSAGGGNVCFDGTCVACLHDADCGQAPDCHAFQCQADHTCKEVLSMDGSSCGNGGALTCMGGVCGGCSDDASCGTSDFCVTFTCDPQNRTCSSTPQHEGQPTGDNVTGDCQVNVCQAGMEVTNVDTSDVPADDGNPCTTEQCQGSTPVHVNKNLNDSCGGNNVCDAQDPPQCVRCTPTSNNCPSMQVCFLESCCAPQGEVAACAGKCSGMASDGCGGMVACDLTACGSGTWECNTSNNTCCTKPSLGT